ncbi:MAG TPA: fibronectin type III domain-containing protein, partial [Phycisphaerae bacterium]|nr:fibronectin type III domain-containing protein [Phycisphaerae bacterium]
MNMSPSRSVFEPLEPRLLLDGAPHLPGLYLVDPNVDNLQGQVVYIDYDGEENVTYNGPVTVGPFDVPAFLAPDSLAGQEAEIMSALTMRLNNLFADTGVRFTLERPEDDTPHSTIFVGGTDAPFREYGTFFGLAEHVDVGNLDRNDRAFVFSDNIDLTQPLTESNDRTLSGVLAHETGRLLGYDNAQTGAFESPLASVAAVAPDADRTFTHPAENNGTKYLTLAANTYTFEIDADPNGSHNYEWYNTYSGTGGLQESGWLYYYDDHNFTFSAGNSYWVRAEIYDNNWNWQAAYRWYVTCPQPNRPPTQPGSLSSSSVTRTSATVSWGASSDPDGNPITYEVQYGRTDVWDGWTSAGTTTGTSKNLTGLYLDSRYTVRVIARDNQGAESAWREQSALFRTQANYTPTTPGGLSASSVGKTSATVSWGASSDSNGDTITYEVEYGRTDVWDGWTSAGTTTS